MSDLGLRAYGNNDEEYMAKPYSPQTESVKFFYIFLIFFSKLMKRLKRLLINVLIDVEKWLKKSNLKLKN